MAGAGIAAEGVADWSVRYPMRLATGDAGGAPGLGLRGSNVTQTIVGIVAEPHWRMKVAS